MNLLDQAIKHWEAKYPSAAWSGPNDRQRLLGELSREVGNAVGQWRTKAKGTAIDIQEYITAKVKAGNFTKIKDFDSKYVSPFPARSSEILTEHSIHTRNFLSQELTYHRYEFTSDDAKNKLLEMFSTAFLPEDGENGIVYRKIHNNSIPSQKAYSLDELLNETGAYKYIDRNKTELKQKLHKHEQKALASKLVDDPSHPAQMERALKMVAQAEHGVKVGRRINVIDPLDLKREFELQAIAEHGKPMEMLNGQDKNIIESKTAEKMARVDSLDSIKKAVSEIHTYNGPDTWQFSAQPPINE